MFRVPIYTIGHSTAKIDDFLNTLRKFGINCVVDIRSRPSSINLPCYDKDKIHIHLKQCNFNYLYLGDLLGARQTEESLCFNDGKVNYEKVAMTKQFLDTIERLEYGYNKGFKIALMCLEKEPLSCHRFLLIGRELASRGYDIRHIID